MKPIKIWFADLPFGAFGMENNWITKTLKENYEVEFSKNPDFLFYDIFGLSNLDYTNCVKVFFTGEACIPDFTVCDYAFSFNYLDFGDRHMRAILGDLYADTITTVKPDIQDTSSITEDMAGRRFCNFIYSQDKMGKGSALRRDFCQELMKYKRVDCPGLVLNNMPKGSIAPRWKRGAWGSGDVTENWNQGKLDFLTNYKFTIAFENLSLDGYTTEKLLHPFMARSVPIYWGNPLVVQDFNPKAFVNCNEFDSLDEVIERIKELDQDDEQYLEMLRQSPMSKNYDFAAEQKAKEFLFQIIERGNAPFDKDPLGAGIINQIYKNISIAWQAIIHTESSMTWKIVNKLQKFFQTKFGKLVKSVLKPILRFMIKIYRGIKKIFHKGN